MAPRFPIPFIGGMARTTEDGGVRVDTTLGSLQFGGRPESHVARLFEQEVNEQQRDARQTLTSNEMQQIIARADRDNVKIGVKVENNLFRFSLNGGEYGPPLRVDNDALQMWSDSRVATGPTLQSMTARPAPEPIQLQEPVQLVASPTITANDLTTSLPTVSLDPVTSSQMAALTSTQVAALTSTQAAAITSTQVASLTTTQVAAITPGQGYSDADRASMDALVDAVSVDPAAPERALYSRQQLTDLKTKISSGSREHKAEAIAAVEKFLEGRGVLKADGKLTEDELTAAYNLIEARCMGTPEDRAKLAALGTALGVQGVSAPTSIAEGSREPSYVPIDASLQGPDMGGRA